MRNGSMISSIASRGSDSAAAKRLDADRPAAVVLGDGREIAPVHGVEAGGIDFELEQRPVGELAVDLVQPAGMGEVADAAQQPAGDARRAARAPRDLVGAVRRHADAEHAGAAVDDQFELGLGVEIQPHRNAEAVAQRIGEQARARGGADQRELARDRSSPSAPPALRR